MSYQSVIAITAKLFKVNEDTTLTDTKDILSHNIFVFPGNTPQECADRTQYFVNKIRSISHDPYLQNQKD